MTLTWESIEQRLGLGKVGFSAHQAEELLAQCNEAHIKLARVESVVISTVSGNVPDEIFDGLPEYANEETKELVGVFERYLDLDNAEIWSQLRVPSDSCAEKSYALAELVRRDDANVQEFIITELSKAADLPWIDSLLASAERVSFDKQTDREKLKEILLETALKLRLREEPPVRDMVCSALRKFCHIGDPDDVTKLSDFLDVNYSNGEGVDVRLVALQGVQVLLSSRPLTDNESPGCVADKVFDIAHSFLDPQVLTSGSNTALARNAVHALALLGDERILDCLERVNQAGIPCLKDRLKQALERTREQWLTSDTVGGYNREGVSLSQCISLLESS